MFLQTKHMHAVNTVQLRLARYYLGRLRAANMAYRRGQASSADSLTILKQEWPQIAQWQAWAAAQSPQSVEAAQLSVSYAQDGADILIMQQTLEERVTWLEAGLAAARAIGDARAAALCLFRIAWATHKRGALEQAEVVAREVLAQAEAFGDTLLIGQSLHLLGELAVRRGDIEQAERLHLRSLVLLQTIDAQAALADVYFSLSENAYLRGDSVAARDYSQQCYHIHTALGLNPITNNNLTWLGAMTADAGDLDAGEAYVRQSVALCRVSCAQSTLAHGLMNLCEFMLLRDAWEEARSYAEEGLQIAQSIGETWLIPYGLIAQANIYSRSGEHAAAQSTVGKAVALARDGANRITVQNALIHLAEIQIRANEVERAAIALHEALAIAVQTGVRVKMLSGVLVATKLWYRRGDAIRAAEWAGLLLHSPGVDYALRRDLRSLCSELTRQLGEARFAAAVDRGKALDLDTVAAHIVSALAEQPVAAP